MPYIHAVIRLITSQTITNATETISWNTHACDNVQGYDIIGQEPCVVVI